MTILDVIDIYSIVNNYLSEKDQITLGHTCSRYKALKLYKLRLRITDSTYSVDRLNQVAKLALHAVVYLDLSYCYLITDVSMLTDLHSVNLTYCLNATNIKKLANVCVLEPFGETYTGDYRGYKWSTVRETPGPLHGVIHIKGDYNNDVFFSHKHLRPHYFVENSIGFCCNKLNNNSHDYIKKCLFSLIDLIIASESG